MSGAQGGPGDTGIRGEKEIIGGVGYNELVLARRGRSQLLDAGHRGFGGLPGAGQVGAVGEVGLALGGASAEGNGGGGEGQGGHRDATSHNRAQKEWLARTHRVNVTIRRSRTILVVGDGAEKREETHRTIVGGEKGGFVGASVDSVGCAVRSFSGWGTSGKRGLGRMG